MYVWPSGMDDALEPQHRYWLFHRLGRERSARSRYDFHVYWVLAYAVCSHKTYCSSCNAVNVKNMLICDVQHVICIYLHIIHYDSTYNIDIQIHNYHILVWSWQMTIVTDVAGTARGLEASNSLEAVRQAAVRKPPAFCHPSWPGLQSHSRCLGPQKTDLEHLFLWYMIDFATRSRRCAVSEESKRRDFGESWEKLNLLRLAWSAAFNLDLSATGVRTEA